MVTLEVGKQYIIDEGFRNSGIVELVESYGKIFVRVKNPDSNTEWDTMAYRLSEIRKGK